MPQTHRGWVGQAVFEKRLKIKEEHTRLLFVIATIASMLFAAEAAYAMGGGGHRGDGRRDFSRPANAALQGANDQNDNSGNRGQSANAALQGANDQNDPPVPITPVPEPITALLLGIGICLTTGFIVTKRKRES
jgi:hypothetical protein